MSDAVNVLVVFYSRYGTTERLALAAGLGAIQEAANIRLRRLPDEASPEAINADPAWRESVARMNRDYVAPRPADPVWADVIVLAAPPDSPLEVESYVASLPACGPMAGKIAAPFTAGTGADVLRAVSGAAACAGLMVAPPGPATDDAVGGARAHGQALVRLARALKAAATA